MSSQFYFCGSYMIIFIHQYANKKWTIYQKQFHLHYLSESSKQPSEVDIVILNRHRSKE